VANDNLRAALQQAGLTADDLAEIVTVDVRTVRRWLSGRTPYPRQRGKVARALDATEHNLWPETAAAAPRTTAATPTDLIAAYTTTDDPDVPDWKALMRAATDRIELLGDTLIPILGTPGVPELLAAKAAHGCEVRILILDPGRHLAPLLEQSGIHIRVLEAPAHQTIYRFDEQLLLILHLLDEDDQPGPLLHLRHAAEGGLFDRIEEHYHHLWEDVSQPIQPDLDLAFDDDDEENEGESPEADRGIPNTEHPTTGRREPAPPPPRRWPRRPT
jgi:transcriptional regulator with XRE-family HTH domain